MAGPVYGHIATVFLPSELRRFNSIGTIRSSVSILSRLGFAGNVRAMATSSAAVVKTRPLDVNVAEGEASISTGQNILACPICYDPLVLIGSSRLTLNAVSKSTLQCNTCNKAYNGTESHLELAVASGSQHYGEAMAPSTEFFRIPLISYLYERGWRQSFSFWGGFPGPENEFDLMKGFLKPVLGGNIVDASCGSGLFSRLFTKSGLFSLVVALDYSEYMLKQCYAFVREDENFPKEKLLLVRADVARLPFVSCSLDAVHAGAALHCWPSPSTAVAEINRVLRPGGVFVATTYLLDGPFAFIPFLRPLRLNIMRLSGGHIFLAERELEDLCRACGLVNFRCVRNQRFVMISATKPG